MKITRHVKIRYLLVADRVISVKVNIKYCPTGDTTGGYFIKPLQGSKFSKFRNKIINIKSSDDGSNPTYEDNPNECIRD